MPILLRLLLRRNRTLVRTNAIARITEVHKLFKKICIHSSRHIIINTDAEEEAGKCRMGRGHWVTDVCYTLRELSLAF